MISAAKPEDDQYVVLGIWLEEERDDKRSSDEVNRFFGELAEQVRERRREVGAKPRPITLDLNQFIPPSPPEFYRYERSLTTKLHEDNVETVRWVVYRHALAVSRQRLDEYKAIGHDARPKQDMNRRFVIYSLPQAGHLA